MLKVRDFPNLQRDPKSKAIVNVNQTAYNEYLQRNIVKEKMSVNVNQTAYNEYLQRNIVKEKMSHMDNEINNIKETVNDIKNLLTKLADK